MMSDQKISHYKVPYTFKNGELVLDDSKREFIKDESINIAEGGVLKISTQILEANTKEKDIAIGVAVEEGFVIMQYLT